MVLSQNVISSYLPLGLGELGSSSKMSYIELSPTMIFTLETSRFDAESYFSSGLSFFSKGSSPSLSIDSSKSSAA